MKKVLVWLASTQCAVLLFLMIALLAIPGTFTNNRAIYVSPPFVALLGCFGLNLVLCTIQRLKSISKHVLILHGGVILTLAGCIATSFGYVETVNVYEGTSVDQVFRWDSKQDVALGFDLKVEKINYEFYPIPVKVGVLKGQQKEKLFVLKSGESFEYNSYRIKVESLDPDSGVLKLSIYDQDKKIGTYATSGISDLPPDFPYSFLLVAFQNPFLKRMWVDLKLSRDSGEVVEGISEINNPFRWDGLYFYNTQVSKDPSGKPYAGIQIVNDPGRPIVFAGFAVMGLGAVLSFKRRFIGKGKWKI